MDRRLLRIHALPAGALAFFTVVDLAMGRGPTVLGLVVISPLVAATVVRRRATAVYAVLAVVVAVLLGFYDRVYGPGQLTAQLVRLLGVAAGGGIALSAATLRLHQDRQLARARQAAEEARNAVALVARLQRSLLTDPPPVPGLETAVRYLPAVRQAHVGGDWYDSFALPCGATMLVIGDVSGHDVEAAVTMAEARALLRGIAAQSEGQPAAVLSGLDAALQQLRVDTLITTVVAVLRQDGDGALLRWSNAGHPPPAVVHADGSVELLARSSDLLLGMVGGSPRQDHEARLEPGATLLLYTDGLVERRGTTIDAGLSWLTGELAELAGEPLQALCDALVAGMSDRLEDDVALLAVRLAG